MIFPNVKQVKSSIEKLTLKQRNALGAFSLLMSMFVLCFFIFSQMSDVVSYKYLPFVFLGLVGLYIFNDFLFDAVFGDKMSRDYFYRLGLSQRYMLPFAIIVIFLFFKFNTNF